MEEEKNIEPEFKARDELTEWIENIKTFDQLVDFLEDVKEHYYGCERRVLLAAIMQACLAVSWYLSKEFEIPETGLKLIDYDEMLYPQNGFKFEKTISSDTWERLQETAKRLLGERGICAELDVFSHWKSIADGKVPFGYTVKD